ncbi:hypothetical protein [Hallella bergensis]|uniref:hypothetical protein n=1 Tax=Hallella bergensis TaxID=242750 RepID=UPI0023F43332|nr:hypothetical protein [Hallella bergensis]
MKKNYVSPRADIIYTNIEDALLAGSDVNGHFPGGTGAKAHDFDLDDFSDESLWSDEMYGNNK